VENDEVQLLHDVAVNLRKGDRGVVIECYGHPPTDAYVIEFEEQGSSGFLCGSELQLVKPEKKVKNERQTSSTLSGCPPLQLHKGAE
jgi:hypothetical protein